MYYIFSNTFVFSIATKNLLSFIATAIDKIKYMTKKKISCVYVLKTKFRIKNAITKKMIVGMFIIKAFNMPFNLKRYK